MHAWFMDLLKLLRLPLRCNTRLVAVWVGTKVDKLENFKGGIGIEKAAN